MGTPAYMAPEQARGEVADTRADVFALGGILTAILTGKAVFGGKSAVDTVQRAARGDTADALLRLTTCGADPELVAVATGCLQASRDDRPADGGAVAKLVADYRHGVEERLKKAEADRAAAVVREGEQRKRRRQFNLAAGLIAAVLLVGVAGTTWGLLRADDKRRDAETALEEKGKALDEKEAARQAEVTAKTAAQQAQAAAEQKRKEAERAREVTTEQRRLALDTVRGIIQEADNVMKNDPRLAPLRVTIIQRMVGNVDRIRDHAQKNPLADLTEAIAYSRLGEIYDAANKTADAAVCRRKSHAILERLHAKTPADPNAVRNLAIISHSLAEVEWRLGNGPRSRELHGRVVDLWRKRLAIMQQAGKSAEPDRNEAEWRVAEALAYIAYDDLRLGDPAAAIENYTASEKAFAALPPPLPNLIPVHRTRHEIKVRLGAAHCGLGRLDDAEKLFRAALADREALLAETPQASGVADLLKMDIGQSRMFLGDFFLMHRKDRAAATTEYAACREIFSVALKAEPGHFDRRQRLAATHYRLGLAAVDPNKAKEAFAESLRLRQELAAIDPKDAQSGVEVAIALARVGNADEAERVTSLFLWQAGNDPQVLLQAACTLGILAGGPDKERAARSREQAFHVLRDLVKAGWKDRGSLESDPDFEFVRTDPRFAVILNALKNPGELDRLALAPVPRPIPTRRAGFLFVFSCEVPVSWSSTLTDKDHFGFGLPDAPGPGKYATLKDTAASVTCIRRSGGPEALKALKKDLAEKNPYDPKGAGKNVTGTGTVRVGGTDAEYLDVRFATVAKGSKIDPDQVHARQFHVFLPGDGQFCVITYSATNKAYDLHWKDVEAWLRTVQLPQSYTPPAPRPVELAPPPRPVKEK